MCPDRARGKIPRSRLHLTIKNTQLGYRTQTQRLCYQCPLTAQHIENGIKMVLGPPKRYGIKMVKKWYGQFQRGLPKDGRYGLEMVKKWSETTFLPFPDHICHLWGDPSGIAHTIFSPFSYHTFWGSQNHFYTISYMWWL